MADTKKARGTTPFEDLSTHKTISIKIKSHSEAPAFEHNFRIDLTTPLEKVFSTFRMKRGHIGVMDHAFEIVTVDGGPAQVLLPHVTPKTLNLKDGDVITARLTTPYSLDETFMQKVVGLKGKYCYQILRVLP